MRGSAVLTLEDEEDEESKIVARFGRITDVIEETEVIVRPWGNMRT